MLHALGEWINIFSEACVGTKNTGIDVKGADGDFIMKGNDAYYLFCHDLVMVGASDVVINDSDRENYVVKFSLPEKIKSIEWLVTGGEVEFKQQADAVSVFTTPQPYGQSVVVRIAKINI